MTELTEIAGEGIKWVGGVAVPFVIRHFYTSYKSTKDFREESLTTLKGLVTDVKAIKKDVQILQMMQESTFDMSGTALFICDSKGLCVEVNDALLSIFNTTADQMYGYGWLSFIHPDDVDRVKKTWEMAVNSYTIKITDHYRVVDKDTYKVINECHYKAIFRYDADNKLNRAIGSVWVVGEKETADEKLTCIFNFIQDLKDTPTMRKLNQEIKEKSKK
jgi:PAS domain S-box-containing protein